MEQNLSPIVPAWPGIEWLGWCFLALTALALVVRVVHTWGARLPDFADLPPTLLGFCKRRWTGVLQVILFRLWQGEHLAITQEEGRIRLQSLPNPPRGADPLTRAVHHHLRQGRELKEFLSDRRFRKRHREPLGRLLEPAVAAGLMRNHRQRREVALLLLVTLVVLVWLSPFDTLPDWPVWPFWLLWGGAAWYSGVLDPFPFTILGRRFVGELGSLHHWMDGEVANRTLPRGVDPEMLVALYGLGGVAGILGLPLLPTPLPQSATPADGGGCGGCGYGESLDDSADGGGDGGGCGSDGGGCGGGCGGD